jgi:hypothetical protein
MQTLSQNSYLRKVLPAKEGWTEIAEQAVNRHIFSSTNEYDYFPDNFYYLPAMVSVSL